MNQVCNNLLFFTYLTYLLYFYESFCLLSIELTEISASFSFLDNPLAGDFNLCKYFISYILACALSVIVHAHSSIVV